MIMICGVDEAGRGPLAGPVYAAAVILNPEREILDLADSKTISENQRNLLNFEIKKYAICWAINFSTVEEIDRLNILQASLLAMSRAIKQVQHQLQFLQQFKEAKTIVQVDGNKCPETNLPCEAIVKGDSKVKSISAASILAKVARDQELYKLDNDYPQYGFAKHKGYPTALHLDMLRLHGISPVHRRSYAPVKKLMI